MGAFKPLFENGSAEVKAKILNDVHELVDLYYLDNFVIQDFDMICATKN